MMDLGLEAVGNWLAGLFAIVFEALVLPAGRKGKQGQSAAGAT